MLRTAISGYILEYIRESPAVVPGFSDRLFFSEGCNTSVQA